VEPPNQANIKRKALIVIKARQETKEAGFPGGIENEIVFMEINKPILDNLYNLCYVSSTQRPHRKCAHQRTPTWFLWLVKFEFGGYARPCFVKSKSRKIYLGRLPARARQPHEPDWMV